MVDRVPSARVVGRAVLPGFELRFHKRGWRDGTGKANAAAAGDANAVVHGVVYEIDAWHLADLDVHETGYERNLERFAVGAPDGEREVEAWIYLALSDVIDDDLFPTRRYRDHVLRGARAHGLPSSLIVWLERHPTRG